MMRRNMLLPEPRKIFVEKIDKALMLGFQGCEKNDLRDAYFEVCSEHPMFSSEDLFNRHFDFALSSDHIYEIKNVIPGLNTLFTTKDFCLQNEFQKRIIPVQNAKSVSPKLLVNIDQIIKKHDCPLSAEQIVEHLHNKETFLNITSSFMEKNVMKNSSILKSYDWVQLSDGRFTVSTPECSPQSASKSALSTASKSQLPSTSFDFQQIVDQTDDWSDSSLKEVSNFNSIIRHYQTCFEDDFSIQEKKSNFPQSFKDPLSKLVDELDLTNLTESHSDGRYKQPLKQEPQTSTSSNNVAECSSKEPIKSQSDKAEPDHITPFSYILQNDPIPGIESIQHEGDLLVNLTSSQQQIFYRSADVQRDLLKFESVGNNYADEYVDQDEECFHSPTMPDVSSLTIDSVVDEDDEQYQCPTTTGGFDLKFIEEQGNIYLAEYQKNYSEQRHTTDTYPASQFYLDDGYYLIKDNFRMYFNDELRYILRNNMSSMDVSKMYQLPDHVEHWTKENVKTYFESLGSSDIAKSFHQAGVCGLDVLLIVRDDFINSDYLSYGDAIKLYATVKRLHGIMKFRFRNPLSEIFK